MMGNKFRLARFAGAIAAGLLVAAVLATPAAAAGTGTIQGTFTTSTGDPIAGAYVNAYSTTEDYLDGTITDPSGHYEMTGVAAGDVKLNFQNQGLEQWSPGQRSSATATAYTLTAGGTLTVDEQQLATGTIAGHFTDSSGQPAQAYVTAEGIDYWGYGYGNTDETGAYRIEALPGTYRVYFQWDNVLQYAFQAPNADAAATITVTAGQTTTVDDHKLPTGTVGGRLTTADGSPLPDALVTLHRDGNAVGAASTDTNGNYSFGEVLARDGYTLSFSVNGGAEQWVPHTLDQTKAQNFTVVAGQHTTIDDAQMATGTVQGRLVDADGSPKVGYYVNVTLDDQNNWVNFSAVTDENGSWSITGVYPGNYRVSFQTPDWGRTQWAYGAGSEADAKLIAVDSGATVRVDDTWLPGATLVVNAVDATTGVPVTNFCAWVDASGNGTGCTTGSQVTVSDLPGGSFHVTATPDESSYYLPGYDVPVILTPGQTTTVSVPLTLGGKIAFTATDRANGRPVADTCAAFEMLGGGGLPDGVGECANRIGKGSSIAKVPGSYEMFAVAPGAYGHQWVGATGGTGDQKSAARIVVKPGKTVQAPPVVLDKAGTITGVVTDAAGKPVGGGDVAYSAWGDAGPAWDTEIDANGRYTLDKLGPYSWPLLFEANGYPRQWTGHKGNRFKADTVSVVAGGTTTYDFTPTKGSKMTGVVTVPGAPPSNWRLNVFNAATGDQMAVVDSSAARPDGSYSIPIIGSQDVKIKWSYYRIGVSAGGWYDHAADFASATEVDIPGNGGTATLSLTLN